MEDFVGEVMSNEANNFWAKFMKVYSGLPIEERKRTIVVLDNGEPVNWEMAYRELKNNTKLGREIKDKLIKLDII